MKTKKALFLGISLIIVITSVIITTNNKKQAAFNVLNQAVLIDAGHGGFDGGAQRNGVPEAPINLEIALKLRKELLKLRIDVFMTRAGSGALADTKSADMKRRAEMVKDAQYAAVVSIHQNAFNSKTAQGATVYYKPGCEISRQLAQITHKNLATALNTTKPREIAEGDFLLLNCSTAPAILVECGFISNNAELLNLLDNKYQQLLAKTIAESLQEFLNATISIPDMFPAIDK